MADSKATLQRYLEQVTEEHQEARANLRLAQEDLAEAAAKGLHGEATRSLQEKVLRAEKTFNQLASELRKTRGELAQIAESEGADERAAERNEAERRSEREDTKRGEAALQREEAAWKAERIARENAARRSRPGMAA